MTHDRPPSEHQQTWREKLYQVLREGPQTVRELSILVGAPQKELIDHLAHLERSLARGEERLVVEPARCLACDFAFTERTRLAKPSRCPRCKSSRITLPRFAVSDA